ncbi:hypothetical protein [Lutibacter sp. B1]|uniref:hypothetical protein n=1 Tax=Lutibacter sp. B1 TaxID=2725996 RepID=UPI0014567987|nr:hypothetical protein [Lutibacter sp. B1]NLP56965.1 hypothetical protein [Lutibacter sp. B1]
MKKLVILFLLFTIAACNDGDFDVPAFDFTENLNKCGEYVLYRANTDKTEALILTLKEGHLTTDSFNVSNNITLTYRVFDESFGTNYFCQSIPPSSPKVLKELKADSNTSVNIIETVETEIRIDTLSTGVKIDTIVTSSYEINFTDMVLKNDQNDKIYYESYDFGTFEIIN